MIVVISVVGGILLVILAIVGYLFYRGYGKIKGKALSGMWTLLRLYLKRVLADHFGVFIDTH